MSPAQEVRLYYSLAAVLVVGLSGVVIGSIVVGWNGVATHALFAQFVALTVQLFAGAVADRMGIKL